jgi:hypothetical protein
MAITDRVKLVVVRNDSPDIETTVGTFPTRDAMKAFRQIIAKEDTLRVTIEPIEGERTDDNFASYQR